MIDPGRSSTNTAELMQRALDSKAAFEAMARKASAWMWFHIAVMLLAVLLALVLSPWYLIWTAAHWGMASAWEEMNPRTWARRQRILDAHSEQLLAVYESHVVIERLRRDELDRANPWRVWAAYAISIAAPMIGFMVAARGGMFKKGFGEGYAGARNMPGGLGLFGGPR